mmetsp:Transcript_15463/g.36761  ORF Transcript_15463/g.36761 Transcript_15463/m.36761 type:complete len:280 (-) Transcript_15463:71-910(-)
MRHIRQHFRVLAVLGSCLYVPGASNQALAFSASSGPIINTLLWSGTHPRPAPRSSPASFGFSPLYFHSTCTAAGSRPPSPPPPAHAVVFNVEMQLTQDEACKSDSEFVEHARETFMDFLDGASSNFHTVQVLGFSRSLNGVVCPNRRALRKLLADFSAATAEVQMMIVYQDKAIFNDKAFAEMPGITSVAVDAGSASNVKVDPTYTNSVPNSSTTPSSSESSSNNTAMIAGIAGGIGGAVLLLAGALLLMRSRRSEEPMATAVQTIDVRDLKAQLSDDA